MKTGDMKAELLAHRAFRKLGIELSYEDAKMLLRAERTLHRWCEGCCGMSNNKRSWHIERDDSGLPHRKLVAFNNGCTVSRRVPDLEAATLRKLEKLGNIYYYYQRDPRGCALYISDKKLDGSNYTCGLPCAI